MQKRKGKAMERYFESMQDDYKEIMITSEIENLQESMFNEHMPKDYSRNEIIQFIEDLEYEELFSMDKEESDSMEDWLKYEFAKKLQEGFPKFVQDQLEQFLKI